MEKRLKAVEDQLDRIEAMQRATLALVSVIASAAVTVGYAHPEVAVMLDDAKGLLDK